MPAHRHQRVDRLRQQRALQLRRQTRVHDLDLLGGVEGLWQVLRGDGGVGEGGGFVRRGRGVGGEAIEEAADDGAGEGGRVREGGVDGQEWRGGDFVGEDVDLEVGLEDGHFDVEGGDFVGEALWSNMGRLGKRF